MAKRASSSYPVIQVIAPGTGGRNEKSAQYTINHIKLNEQGFPIVPGMGTFREEQSLTISNSPQNSRLKGFRDADPNYRTVGAGSGYKGVLNKYFGIPYNIQRKIAREFSILASILRLRAFQSAKFTTRSKDPEEPGLKVRLKDETKEPTQKEIEEMREMEEHILQTGRRDFDASILRKDRFPQFVEKIFRDVYTFDRVAVSRRMSRDGELVDFVVIDAATIKPIDPFIGYDGDMEVLYVQEVNGRIIETFKAGEIIVDWMYQTTDIEHQNHGWSPLEEAFKEIRSTIDALRYNHGNFSQNRAPKGFFVLPDKLTDDQLDEMEERWNALFNGADHVFRTPFFSGSDGIKYQSVGANNRDMEYDKYMQLLLQIFFSVYSVDPIELGWKLDRSPSSGGLDAGGGVRSQQASSKDRGLGAGLDFCTRIINRLYEGTKWGEKYEAYFTGRKSIDRDQDLERDVKKLSNFAMLAEIRARNDLKPLHEEVADILEGMEEGDEKKSLIDDARKNSLLILNAQYIQGRQGSQPTEDGEPFDDDDEPFEKSGRTSKVYVSF